MPQLTEITKFISGQALQPLNFSAQTTPTGSVGYYVLECTVPALQIGTGSSAIIMYGVNETS
jgi:hypothetical protein